MKFSAKVIGLLNGLQPAIACATTNPKREYPDAGKVSLTVKKDKLIAAAHNGNVAITNEIATQSNLDYQSGKEGSVTVKATDLLNLINTFSLDCHLNVELQGNELVFSDASDDSENEKIPTELRNIEMPQLAENYGKEMVVRREVLNNAMSKVLYAIGFEKFRPEFLYWVLRVKNGSLRACCGDGARFAVYEIEGDNVVETQKPFDLCVHKEHSPVMSKVFGLIPEEKVTVKSYSRENENDSLMDQIVVTVGTAQMTLVGHDPGVKWPDEKKFLSRENNLKYATSAADWEAAVKGAMATYNDDIRKVNQIHTAQLIFDTDKKTITVKTDAMMKSNRKVKMKDAWAAEGDGNMTFTCVSTYLNDMLKFAGTGPQGGIQLEFSNDKAPVVVRFYATDTVTHVDDGTKLYNTNKTTGTREQYTMFFAAYNRK